MKASDLSDCHKELIKAVSGGNKNEVKNIFANYLKMRENSYDQTIKLKTLVNCTDELGRTSLHIAACSGFSEICKLLIDNGADVNIESESCPSPLMLAASKNRIAVVLVLLKYDVIVSRTGENWTAIDEAADKGYNIIKNIIKRYVINDAIDCCIRTRSKEHDFLLLKIPLCKLLMIENKHPARLIAYLKENVDILRSIDKFINAFNVLCVQQFKERSNERLSWICHCIGYFFAVAQEYLNSRKVLAEVCKETDSIILDSLIKSWLEDEYEDSYSRVLLIHMDKAISSYPFKNSEIYKTMT